MSELNGDSSFLLERPARFPLTDTYHVVNSRAISSGGVGRVAADVNQQVPPETLGVTGQGAYAKQLWKCDR